MQVQLNVDIEKIRVFAKEFILYTPCVVVDCFLNEVRIL